MQIELVLKSSYLALGNVSRQAEKSNKLLRHKHEVDLNGEDGSAKKVAKSMTWHFLSHVIASLRSRLQIFIKFT